MQPSWETAQWWVLHPFSCLKYYHTAFPVMYPLLFACDIFWNSQNQSPWDFIPGLCKLLFQFNCSSRMIWKCFHRSGIWKCWGGLRGGQVHLKRGAALALVERPLLVVGLTWNNMESWVPQGNIKVRVCQHVLKMHLLYRQTTAFYVNHHLFACMSWFKLLLQC